MSTDRAFAYIKAPNQFVESRGRRLAYRAVGKGKPLVLCTRFRVITFDYAGLGLSTGTPTYSPLALADDARDLIEALDVQNAIIGGWSLGGMAAQVFVAKYPQFISHAVLLATVPPGPNVKGATQRFHDLARKISNDFEDHVVLFFDPDSPASRAAAQRSAQRLTLRREGRSEPIPHAFATATLPPEPRSPLFPADAVLQALKHTQVPILHIGGDHDIVFPVENWYALNGQLPTVQLLTFPQAGHGPHHQHPEAVARHMAAFVHTASG